MGGKYYVNIINCTKRCSGFVSFLFFLNLNGLILRLKKEYFKPELTF